MKLDRILGYGVSLVSEVVDSIPSECFILSSRDSIESRLSLNCSTHT